MSWRTIVISQRAKLDLKLGYMVIRSEETRKVHLGEIAVLIIENIGVSLTCCLLEELIIRKVKVIFCNSKRNPHSELVACYGSHDCSQQVRQQIKWEKHIKDLVWTCIVIEKIKNQHDLLKHYKLKEYELLAEYIKEVEIGDVTNREGHAAKVYFNSLFGKAFLRSDETPTNAALNYGYSIILSIINREVVSLGYLTQLGIFHDNIFNQFNLSSDLIEPLRLFVDIEVKKMQPEKFEKEEKYALFDLLNRKIKIGGTSQILLNGIKIYVKSVFDAINESDIAQIKFCRII